MSECGVFSPCLGSATLETRAAKAYLSLAELVAPLGFAVVLHCGLGAVTA